MLEITALSKTYSNGECALSDISFSLAKGEILAVIGHSGAGKSTLLRCINRMEECEGEIKMAGISITKAKKGELRRLRCNIAMMHQNYNLVESLSVIENVLHGQIGRIGFLRGLFGIYTNEEKKEALAIIEEVGLTEFAFRTCLTLSGGQKQRVGIGRAIMQNAAIILADEPTSSLDIATSESVLNLIKKLVRNKGVSVIVNLHQIELAKNFADRIIGLKKGRIVFEGNPSMLTEQALKTIF